MTSVTVDAGGNLAPGDSLGTLSVSGSLILSSGAVMEYELDTPSTSSLVLMPLGQLVLSGQQFADFDFTPTANFAPGIYPLIEAGSISGSLGASTTGTIDGYPATLAVQGNDLVLNVTPEPGTLALLAAGAIALVGYGRGGGGLMRRTAKPTAFDQQDDPPILSFPSHSFSASAARRAA